jgi:salicylate 5-hydroxylase large subunit
MATIPSTRSTHSMLCWPEEGLTRIPQWIYSDPAIYAREQKRIFRGRSWQFVGLSAEIPKPGDFTRSYVGETPVIVARAIDESISVLVNRCTHKGVQLCMAESGTTSAFSCPYHQWTFDLEGHLRGIPFRKGVDGQGGFSPDFDTSEHDLQRLAVTVRNGVIFASFGEDMPSLEQYLGESNLAFFDRVFDGRPLRVLGKMKHRVHTNWKILVENFKDPYHATLLHVFFATFGIWRAGQHTQVRIDPSGGTSTLVQISPVVLKTRKADDIEPTLAAEMKVFRKDLLALEYPELLDVAREFPDNEDTVTMQTIWPNCAVHQNLNSLGLRLALPRGPNQIDVYWTFFGYETDGPDMVARRLRHANFFGPAGLVTCDDLEVWQLNQRGLATEPFATSCVEAGGAGTTDADCVITETAVRAFYKHYRHIMDW